MNEICKQIYDLGITPGSVVLMHSSMKSLGTNLTPEEFLQELMKVVTPEGTLLLPALTYESVTFINPFFSVSETEPCVGILPKTFMKMDGVVRSMHPTHSVCAWGKLAETITAGHINDNTPVGENSPFMQLLEYNGKILFVGDILNSCTFMHGIEEIVKAPYTLNKKMASYTLKDSEGNTRKKDYYTHNFKGWEQKYARIRDILEFPYIRTGYVLQALCTSIDANTLKTAALERFKEDIFSFVSPKD